MQSSASTAEAPRGWKWTWPILIGISLGSLVLYAGLSSWNFAVLLGAVILTHELGHAVVAWVLTRRIPKVFLFLPFFGLTIPTGIKELSPNHFPLLKLAGPGLSSVPFLLLLPFAESSDGLYTFTLFLFVLNLLNLLPIPGLDGGFLAFQLIRGGSRIVRFLIAGVQLALAAVIIVWLGGWLLWVAFGIFAPLMILKAWWDPKDQKEIQPGRTIALWAGAQVVTFTLIAHGAWILLSMEDPLVRVARSIAG